MNFKNAKEIKEKVDEIVKNRTKCIKISKNSCKNDKKSIKSNKKMTKKEKDRLTKFNKFMSKFLIFEYVVCTGILLTVNNMELIRKNKALQQTIESQQETIYNLTETNKKLSNSEIINTQVKYMSYKETSVKTDSRKYLGKFKITHYCACTKCCGKNAKGITASGKKVEENKTIAVDPKVIKLGSTVYIDGYGLMEAQDTGSAIKGNIIDVYIPDHNEALKLGVTYKDVYIVE